ncbi:MAG TPA: tRNA 2-thiouridine(34) synthase MnmA [Thermoanaerobaculaceae bacterium]|nr:tRNA 2-thiouridine(34) synthase MnmA [Thermoanaerobaculaceae bacterium]HRS15702.1 tRNA 2-thiouridine(34) synthase MnmA [Thermoanaerobaculaceae bacterium]
MRVLVALSGGVDSAVAAARLVAQGHEVIGATLRLGDLSACGLGASRCCSPGDLERAARVCWQLGILHHVVEAGETFRREVLDPFVAAYLAARTPSPCVRCNSRVKLAALGALAGEVGAAAVATGHYARVAPASDGAPALWRAKDLERDQSYFLFELEHRQLARLVLPLGEACKRDVRAEAAALGLASAAQPDSQEICFVPPGGSYADVLAALAADRLPPEGDIVDTAGRVLGRHRGLHRYTVGQRQGLSVAAGHRLYVVGLDRARNRVVVGDEHQVKKWQLCLAEVSWLGGERAPSTEVRCAVQVRSRGRPVAGVVTPGPGRSALVELDEPVTAPAPGQAAVFYEGDRVLGGGWIEP